MRKTRLLWMILFLQLCVGVQAQIPQEVKKVLATCNEKMSNPAGIEIDMKVSAGIAFVKFNTAVKMYSKGEKSFTQLTGNVLGKEIKSESGFDGVTEWNFKRKIGDKGADTLTISKPKKKPKGEYDIDLDIDKDYKTAKMKTKGNCYEITFTNPIDKEMPKQTVMLINKNTGYFHEMTAKQSGVSMKMTAVKIKVGVSDSVFKFDVNRYPGAKVIRK